MRQDKTIGILCAMDLECQLLKANMSNPVCQKAAGMELWCGTLEGVKVSVGVSGIGKVHAAICTQVMIDCMGIDAIINTGIAGGVHPDLKVLDLVVSTKAVQYDFDVSAGSPNAVCGYVPGFGKSTVPTYFEADTKLLEIFREVMEKDFPQQNYLEGTIATGDLFVADAEVKRTLWSRFHAYAAEMEGGAVAQAAVCNRVPFLILRAISDLAGDGAALTYQDFAQQAADHSAGILLSMLRHLTDF